MPHPCLRLLLGITSYCESLVFDEIVPCKLLLIYLCNTDCPRSKRLFETVSLASSITRSNKPNLCNLIVDYY